VLFLIRHHPLRARPTFLGGSDNNVTSGVTETYPFTMTGSTGRLIFATAIATGTISSVVFDPGGANVTLALDYSNATGYPGEFYSANIGAVSRSKNIVVTYTTSSAYQQVSGIALLASGLTTGFVTGAQGGSSASISVTSGQLLFGLFFSSTFSGTANFSGSTPQIPSGTRLSTTINGASQYSASADWASTTTASYSVASGSPSGGFTFVATYH
jgi:hypothetical protein